MTTSVTVFAPATVANLATGYDVLGLAVQAPGDTVTATLGGPGGIVIDRITGDDGRLPLAASDNCAGIAAIETCKHAGVSPDITLTVHKGLPIGSGLGSSAASAAAAAVAVNTLLGNPLRKRELIGPCMEAEAVVSGRHADNVAPSLLGGLVLVRSIDPLDVVRLPIAEFLRIVVVTPKFELATRDARNALPQSVALEHMVTFGANLAGLVSACFSGDLDLLGRCLVDPIVTPARAALIPGATQVMQAALDAGAVGSSISGAGPSMFALCRSDASAQRVGQAMVTAFEHAGLSTTVLISPVDCPGARVVH